MGLRTAVYARISDDRTGQGLGVDRQREDCLRYVESRGWTVGEVYIDNDKSAYSGKRRPAYAEMMAAIAEGKFDALVAWHPDRLHRSPRELETFIDTIEAAKVTIGTVTAGEYDLGTPTGRMVARILGATARAESEHKSERIKRKHAQLAQAGEGRGGGCRPYGFQADRLSIDRVEAKVIKEAARRVLAGESIRSITADLNARQVPTVSGTRWSSTVLRQLLTSPRNAGLRAHRGQVVAKAVWPAILDEATHHRLRHLLLDPARRRNIGPARSYLLTGGLALCGLCGHRLISRPNGNKQGCYVCATDSKPGACGKIRALADTLEGYVVELVLGALDDAGLARALARHVDMDDGGLLRQIADGQARLEQLARDHYADRLLGRAEYLAAREAIDVQVEAARAELVSTSTVTPFDGIKGALAAKWTDLGLARQRAIIAAIIEPVVVGPAVRGRNFFDPDRVTVKFRV